MSALSFAALRDGDRTRHLRYYGQGQPHWDLDDWLVAIGGEVGEALNLVKKINRARQGMRGNDRGELETLCARLGDELADVVIYDDIIALEHGTISLGRASAFGVLDFARLRQGTEEMHSYAAPKFERLSSAGRQLLRHVGRMADGVTTRAGMVEQCDFLLSAVDSVAWNAGVDLGAAVIRKFNATSEKLGFPERLAA